MSVIVGGLTVQLAHPGPEISVYQIKTSIAKPRKDKTGMWLFIDHRVVIKSTTRRYSDLSPPHW